MGNVCRLLGVRGVLEGTYNNFLHALLRFNVLMFLLFQIYHRMKGKATIHGMEFHMEVL